VPGHFALGTPQAPGKALDFAQVRGIEGEDAIRLPQLGFLDDDGFGLIISRLGHFNCFYILSSIALTKLITFGQGGL